MRYRHTSPARDVARMRERRARRGLRRTKVSDRFTCKALRSGNHSVVHNGRTASGAYTLFLPLVREIDAGYRASTAALLPVPWSVPIIPALTSSFGPGATEMRQ